MHAWYAPVPQPLMMVSEWSRFMNRASCVRVCIKKLNLSLRLIKRHVVKAYGVVEVKLHVFLPSSMGGCEGVTLTIRPRYRGRTERNRWTDLGWCAAGNIVTVVWYWGGDPMGRATKVAGGFTATLGCRLGGTPHFTRRNIEPRSCNHCCSGKAMSITYYECVFVALGMQHAMRMRHIVICGLPSSTKLFPRYLINGTLLEK